MAQVLRVTIPFADYAKGDEIADPVLIEQYRASHGRHVVTVNVADAPAPAPAAPIASKSDAT